MQNLTLKTILSVLSVIFLTGVNPFSKAYALPSPIQKKIISKAYKGSAYAVFKVSYSPQNPELGVQGGVAGTAFFVTSKIAFTAYHVINAQLFNPAPGFKKARIWLVHENQPAIEIFRTQIQENPDSDFSKITFQKEVTIPVQHIFETENPKKEIENFNKNLVISEGYKANSAGPVLAWINGDLEIQAVHKLEKIIQSGLVLQNTRVSLASADVNLKNQKTVQLTTKPIVGTSGGPVIINGRVKAFNSFANPNDRLSTWAILTDSLN